MLTVLKICNQVPEKNNVDHSFSVSLKFTCLTSLLDELTIGLFLILLPCDENFQPGGAGLEWQIWLRRVYIHSMNAQEIYTDTVPVCATCINLLTGSNAKCWYHISFTVWDRSMRDDRPLKHQARVLCGRSRYLLTVRVPYAQSKMISGLWLDGLQHSHAGFQRIGICLYQLARIVETPHFWSLSTQSSLL